MNWLSKSGEYSGVHVEKGIMLSKESQVKLARENLEGIAQQEQSNYAGIKSENKMVD